jgi:hypothetical protein
MIRGKGDTLQVVALWHGAAASCYITCHQGPCVLPLSERLLNPTPLSARFYCQVPGHGQCMCSFKHMQPARQHLVPSIK